MTDDTMDRLRSLPASAWRVYVGCVLANGRKFPGVKQFAAFIGCSEDTVYRGLRTCHRAGIMLAPLQKTGRIATPGLFDASRRR